MLNILALTVAAPNAILEPINVLSSVANSYTQTYLCITNIWVQENLVKFKSLHTSIDICEKYSLGAGWISPKSTTRCRMYRGGGGHDAVMGQVISLVGAK